MPSRARITQQSACPVSVYSTKGKEGTLEAVSNRSMLLPSVSWGFSIGSPHQSMQVSSCVMLHEFPINRSSSSAVFGVNGSLWLLIMHKMTDSSPSTLSPFLGILLSHKSSLQVGNPKTSTLSSKKVEVGCVSIMNDSCQVVNSLPPI